MLRVDYLFTNSSLILFFYIDDFVILYCLEDKAIFTTFKAALLAVYEIRCLGYLSWFLGIRVIITKDKLYLCQDSYIEKIAEKYNIAATNYHAKTPLSTDLLVNYNNAATA